MKLETNITTMTKRSLPMDVPVTSPYYDRIRALKDERDFASPLSPEHKWINRQIDELTSRAMKRMKIDMNIAF